METIQDQETVLYITCADNIQCAESIQSIAYRGGRIIVCIDDGKQNRPPITLEKPMISELETLNEQGFGIFETVNAFFATEEEMIKMGAKTKRRSEFLSQLLEVYADLDVCKEEDKIPDYGRENLKRELKEAVDNYCPASFYVFTKNGLQPHWKIKETSTDEAEQIAYKSIIKGIIEWSKNHGSKGDPVFDTTRVLRIPGFFHQKGEPYQIISESGSNKIYTLDELKKFFWSENNGKDDKSLSTIPDQNTNIDIDWLDIEMVVIDAWKEKGHAAHFDQEGHLWIDGVKTATFKGRRDGGNYIATTSSDYPAKGNAVTYTAQTLGINNHEAYKRLYEKYNIPQSHTSGFETPEPVTAYELANQEFPPERWIIDQIVPENQITIISGAPGGLKSMSTMEWSMKVALGGLAYDHFATIESAVWYINEDGNHKRLFHDRIHQLSEIWPHNVFFWNNEGFKLQKEWINSLLAKAKIRKVRLIILDSLRAVMPRDLDEMKASDIRYAIGLMRPLIAAGMTIIIIHHDRKRNQSGRGYSSKDITDIGEMMSGSADIRAAVDCHISLRHCWGNDKEPEHIIITQTKCRDGLIKPFRVLVKKDDSNGKPKLRLAFDGMDMPNTAEVTLSKTKAAILEFLSKSSEKYVCRQTIINAKPGGVATRTIEKALASMESDDKSIAAKTGRDLDKNGNEARMKYYFINADY